MEKDLTNQLDRILYNSSSDVQTSAASSYSQYGMQMYFYKIWAWISFKIILKIFWEEQVTRVNVRGKKSKEVS